MTRTRGRTSRGRLRALDAFLVHRERELLLRPGPLRVIDVGLGDEPHTTLEWAESLMRSLMGTGYFSDAARRKSSLSPFSVALELSVLGVDHDRERVQNAQRFSTPHVRFAEGELMGTGYFSGATRRKSSLSPFPVRVVRAMNVLRGAREQDVPLAHAAMAACLEDGGLAIEGSSSPGGELLTAHWLRKRGDALAREALVFHTDLSRGFAPWMFRDWLPRDLRRSVKPGTRVHQWFAVWDSAFRAARAAGASTAVELFVRSAERFSRMPGSEIDSDPWLLSRGFLVWRPSGGIPLTR